ncbi:crotonobetainyl-CoA:carnitine CoA-transferase CaiB-like acyl-CoA transferase [Undibacterium sp. GrIS 1.8]|uniref:CoA transferase n=1 Tax=unclassified Undibacterium TaxID=2630295 RepID=UPI0033947015
MQVPFNPLASLWADAKCDPQSLANLSFLNAEYQLPSSFHVGAIAAATLGAQALAAADIWRLRSGHSSARSQQISIDMKHAMAMFRSERYLTVDGKPPADVWSPIAGYYQAGDGRWIQLHTNFPHHRDGVLRVLECANNRDAVAKAIGGWRAADLDQRLAAEGLCAAMIRTPSEWNAHPQAAAIASLPLLEIIRIGDAPAEPIGKTAQANQPVGATAQRPLSGVRVLDLSRVIAAPVGARTLAQHGADVLAVSAAHLPNIMPLVIDTGRGKRSAQLDLRQEKDATTLRELVSGADIFMQAYRPGALAAQGFSTQALSELRPGLIQVSLSAYSHAGPWAERRGFDSLVQSATGIAWQEGQSSHLDSPGKLPCQALDHATGYLAAFGAMVALQRRAVEGGSWLVRISLAQTGHWLQTLGMVDTSVRRIENQAELSQTEVAAYLQTMSSDFGQIRAIAPVERMSETMPGFDLPPSPLGSHAARWS